jgi:hypothetical protein
MDTVPTKMSAVNQHREWLVWLLVLEIKEETRSAHFGAKKLGYGRLSLPRLVV